MCGYFLWFFLMIFIANAFSYSLFGIEKFSYYLGLVGVLGFLLIIIAFLIGKLLQVIKLEFLANIFYYLVLVGVLLTGSLAVVYPVVGVVKAIPIAFNEVVSIFDSESDQDNIEQFDEMPYSDTYEDYESTPGTHHVDPHWVDGYQRSDGTKVEGYWRGGSDGYERSNPDGNPDNNLNSGNDDSGSFFDVFGW